MNNNIEALRLGKIQKEFIEAIARMGSSAGFCYSGGAADERVRRSLLAKGLLRSGHPRPGYYPIYSLSEDGIKYCELHGVKVGK